MAHRPYPSLRRALRQSARRHPDQAPPVSLLLVTAQRGGQEAGDRLAGLAAFPGSGEYALSTRQG